MGDKPEAAFAGQLPLEVLYLQYWTSFLKFTKKNTLEIELIRPFHSYSAGQEFGITEI
jgi:hypothetical protein